LAQPNTVCDSVKRMDAQQPSLDDLESTIKALRDEIERLKAEIARLRHDRDERPPHYL
jgi:hypothetical protein